MISHVTYRNLFIGVFSAAVLLLAWQFIRADMMINFPLDQNTPLSGYGWSGYNGAAEGIGWVSFSCENDGSCASSSYGVELATDGSISGYAWSPNIGWIKFGGLSGFPGGGGNASMDAYGNLHGWARACAGTTSNDCSTMASRSDGWDGWISLNCANTNDCAQSDFSIQFDYEGDGSVVADGGSYAWGGDTVVGWLDFSEVVLGAIDEQFIISDEPDFALTNVTIDGYQGFTGNPDGSYENVPLQIRITNEGWNQDQTVLYEYAITDTTPAPGRSGSESGSATTTSFSAGEVRDLSHTLSDDIFYGVYTVRAEVNPVRGGTRPIEESDYSNNEMVRDEYVVFPPDPNLELEFTNGFVRQGDPAEMRWSRDTTYPMECTLRGPGLLPDEADPESVTDEISFGDTDTSGTVRTIPRINSARYEITCLEPYTHTASGGDNRSVFVQEELLEVIPGIQER